MYGEEIEDPERTNPEGVVFFPLVSAIYGHRLHSVCVWESEFFARRRHDGNGQRRERRWSGCFCLCRRWSMESLGQGIIWPVLVSPKLHLCWEFTRSTCFRAFCDCKKKTVCKVFACLSLPPQSRCNGNLYFLRCHVLLPDTMNSLHVRERLCFFIWDWRPDSFAFGPRSTHDTLSHTRSSVTAHYCSRSMW